MNGGGGGAAVVVALERAVAVRVALAKVVAVAVAVEWCMVNVVAGDMAVKVVRRNHLIPFLEYYPYICRK